MQEQFIDLDRYNLAVASLEAISRTFEPAAPDDLRTRIVEVLGGLGIWPIDCLREVTTARLAA
ncbi:hypothetical protein [Rhizobium lentis]|uniref:Uncharacterized protein n=1 Tax=Rhizobium lentis TaxID=1138194 RepID=A0A9Q3QWU8_9HYPH|nr:hypothetical protein [Rhizobium lentis]MBX5023043.1 hypothetical protein [Rhizobium lentis]MBX5048105.1 hypothetical protein [Rhizobium lentis]MBX5059622.1 hypothetical protein [Rhizobium lentis]